MTMLVDTSVWSLAFRRDAPAYGPEVPALRAAIDGGHAADIRNVCRRAGVQIGTIDALLGQLCIRHDLILLTTDADLTLAARQCPLRVWSPAL
jgi:hypothetical protein